MLNELKERATAAMQQALTSEAGMKLLADPRVQQALATALTFQATAQAHTRAAVETVARTLNLATKRDLTELRRTVKALETRLATLLPPKH